VELGSGSIEIHRQDIQARLFKALGLTEEQTRRASAFSSMRSPTAPHPTAE